MKKYRKKGALLLWALGLILFLSALGALFLNIVMVTEVVNRVNQTAEEASRIRAQAVDIPLKENGKVTTTSDGFTEYETIIEVLHSPNGYNDNFDRTEYSQSLGHVTPLAPTNERYISSSNLADTAAKEAALEYLTQSIGDNAKGQELLQDFTVDNICIQIKPLPHKNSGIDRLDFECDTKLGPVEAANVKITPLTDEISKSTFIVSEDDETKIRQKAKVVNVVFVGIRYKYDFFIPTIMQGNADPQMMTAWSVAYPQVDRCFIGNNSEVCK